MDTEGVNRFHSQTAALLGVYADYSNREFARVVRFAVGAAEAANGFIQKREPWKVVNEDPKAAQSTCAFAVNMLQLIATVLKPILPELASHIEAFLGVHPLRWLDAGAILPAGHQLGAFERLAERVTPEQVAALTAPAQIGAILSRD